MSRNLFQSVFLPLGDMPYVPSAPASQFQLQPRLFTQADRNLYNAGGGLTHVRYRKPEAHQVLRPRPRDNRCGSRSRAGRDLRIHRPERRGEVHDHQDPSQFRLSDVRLRHNPRHGLRAQVQRRKAGRGLCPSRSRVLRLHDRRRALALLSQLLWAQPE